MTKPLNIGLIGYGFMGKAHSNAYRRVNNFFDLKYRPVLKALCARNAEQAKKFADTWGYESVESDWKKLVARKDIDAIDICVPNNLHHDIAVAAATRARYAPSVVPRSPTARTASSSSGARTPPSRSIPRESSRRSPTSSITPSPTHRPVGE